MDSMELAKVIDHTILSPDCRLSDVERVCKEADENKFASVCVPPYFVKDAARLLVNSLVKVGTVVGFPMGYSATPAKVEEVKRAIDDGAEELDIVINHCAVKNGNWAYVKNDIVSFTTAAHLRGKKVKCVLETSMLTEDELESLCEICIDNGVDYVSTSTTSKNPSLKTVKQLKALLENNVKIKTIGIVSPQKAQEFLEAGASRIGSTKSLQLLEK